MVDSVDFAKIIINRTNVLNKSREEKIALGETKLHKILYICDGLLLATDSNIISENAKAWNYGPVYPRVNRWLKKEPDALEGNPSLNFNAFPAITADVIDLIDAVINKFGQWTANRLSDWSHSPGSPWEMALEKGSGIMNSVIDKNDMKKYFRKTFGE